MMHQNYLTPIYAERVLQDELIDVSSDTLAKHIGVSPTIINEISEGKKYITAPLAMKLSPTLGASPQFWLNLQNNWELSQFNEADYQNIKSIAA